MIEILMAMKDEKTREVLRYILDMFDEHEEVRQIADGLLKKNNKLMNDVLELKKDKQALSAFIQDNVTDIEKLKLIFKDVEGNE